MATSAAWRRAPSSRARRSCRVRRAAASASGAAAVHVFTDSDLRLGDNASLRAAASAAAASGGALLAVYAVDPNAPPPPRGTAQALAALRTALREAGQELVIHRGSAKAAAALGGGGAAVFATEALETKRRALLGAVDRVAALPTAPLRSWGDFSVPPLSASPRAGGYATVPGVAELRGAPQPELDYCQGLVSQARPGLDGLLEALTLDGSAPAEMPPPPKGLEAGELPTSEELGEQIEDAAAGLSDQEVAERLKQAAKAAADKAVAARGTPAANETAIEAAHLRQAAAAGDASALPAPWALEGGEKAALEALDAFLVLGQRSAVSATADRKRLAGEIGAAAVDGLCLAVEEAANSPANKRDNLCDGAFAAVFAPAILSGALSLRVAVARAIQHEAANASGAVWYFDGPVGLTGGRECHVFGHPAVKDVVQCCEITDYDTQRYRAKLAAGA